MLKVYKKNMYDERDEQDEHNATFENCVLDTTREKSKLKYRTQNNKSQTTNRKRASSQFGRFAWNDAAFKMR